MKIINCTPIAEGIYLSQSTDTIARPPDGWAVIPEDFELPKTFPALKNLRVEMKTYTQTVDTIKDVVKTCEIPYFDENGKMVTVEKEYTEKEHVMEEQEYEMLTVVGMEEGEIPEQVETVPAPTQLDRVEAQVTYTALMTDTLLEG